MNLGKCQLTICDQPATWTLTIEGHPNTKGKTSAPYCADHIKGQVNPWDESPTPYTVTISGPHKPNQK